MTTTERLRALLAKATPGPWKIGNSNYPFVDIDGPKSAIALGCECCDTCACTRPDAALIVAAINSLPALLAVVDAAAVVSSQRNGPYLMADMDATMEAENVLKRALEGLNNNEKEKL